MAKKPKKPIPLSAERVERELKALDRMFVVANREGIMSVPQYKKRRKEILQRLVSE